ncbi:MAG: hypothetical protein K9N35_10320 [Candidatus Marinimicrobia bacterium]|nr:hypothetical protein [Candidatus Neomarinimicrobiota bacterium]
MKFTVSTFLFFLTLLIFARADESADSTIVQNPLQEYINDLDEMGRTLSGWQGKDDEFGSWFFGSYALLILSNNAGHDRDPFPTLEELIPKLWSDLKYLTPRYLVELAGGALSYGDLMQISRERPFKHIRKEGKFIQYVAGFSHLRMLEATVGDSLFQEIITTTMSSCVDPKMITDTLSSMVGVYAGDELEAQFQLALTTGSWMDVEISKVENLGDSLAVHIQHKGEWAFPVEVLFISAAGDSSIVRYPINETQPICIAKADCERIELDPEHILSEFYRYNNKWPRLKNNVRIQPFAALPDWEYYRVHISPSKWHDWDGDRRYGVKISSGYGIDLWPAYPSNYRHRYSLELNSHSPVDQESSWGARLNYRNPLSVKNRLFSDIQMHSYDDWTGYSAGLIKYVGKQRFLIQGSALKYQRLTLGVEHDYYADTLIWEDRQNIQVLKTSYSGLLMTRGGERLYLNFSAAAGSGPIGAFSLLKSQADLSGLFWGWLVGGVQFVAGTQDNETPSPYQFTHTYAWQDNLAALPNFRGQNKIEHKTHNYMGLSLSGGYWLSGIQIKLFGSGMIYDQAGIELREAKPQYAAGFGFEHKSFFTAGLYMPVWQSHPIEGEESWAWRFQWRLSWNL